MRPALHAAPCTLPARPGPPRQPRPASAFPLPTHELGFERLSVRLASGGASSKAATKRLQAASVPRKRANAKPASGAKSGLSKAVDKQQEKSRPAAARACPPPPVQPIAPPVTPAVVASVASSDASEARAQAQVHVTAPAPPRFGALRARLAELTEAALRNTTCTRARLRLHVGGLGLQVWPRHLTTNRSPVPAADARFARSHADP